MSNSSETYCQEFDSDKGEDLDALLARLDEVHAQATPPEWDAVQIYRHQSRACIVRSVDGRYDTISVDMEEDDADLTAELRNAYPRLRDEIKRLLQVIADHEADWARVRKMYEHQFPDRPWGGQPRQQKTNGLLSKLEYENERLKADCRHYVDNLNAKNSEIDRLHESHHRLAERLHAASEALSHAAERQHDRLNAAFRKGQEAALRDWYEYSLEGRDYATVTLHRSDLATLRVRDAREGELE